jgi:hypothetical protein
MRAGGGDRRRMPRHTGGKGGCGHRHHTQQEGYVVLASPVGSSSSSTTTTSGEFDASRAAFEKAGVEDVPDEIAKRWSRVYICRDVTDENVALTFGFFQGTLEELRELRRDSGGGPQSGALDAHIAEVLLDGSYEVPEEITP